MIKLSRTHMPVLGGALLFQSALIAQTDVSHGAMDSMILSDFVSHGSPAPVARHRGAVATRDSEGRPIILAWLSTATDAGLLRVDLDSGSVQQIYHPDRVRGRHFLLTDSGKFYTYGDSLLLEYDIDSHHLNKAQGPGSFGYALTEADDGMIYAALNPRGDIVAYNPKTRELSRVGRVRIGTQLQYPRQMESDDTGWLYIHFAQANTIAAFNPVSGEQRVLAEHSEHATGGGVLFRGVDGAVYGRPSIRLGEDVGWVRLHQGQAEAIDGTPDIEPAAIIQGGHSTFHDGLGGGLRVKEFDVATLKPYAIIEDIASGTEQRIEFTYKADGSTIYSICDGPDGRIYGSTGHPRYLFAYCPAENEFQTKLMSGGHLNAMARQGHYVFGGLYASGELHRLDPSKPWDAEGGNPQSLVMARTPEGMITRPYMLAAHTDGRRVIMGGYYDRTGIAGGGLVIHDIETDEIILLNSDDLLEGQSGRAACSLPNGNLLIGTTVETRGRADQLASEAVVYELDMEDYSVVMATPIADGISAVRDLIIHPQTGLVYGMADPSLFFVYDPDSGEIIHREDFAAYGSPAGLQGPRIMALGLDGAVFVLFAQGIIRVDPDTFHHSLVAQAPTQISNGILVKGDRLYFTSGPELWSALFTVQKD